MSETIRLAHCGDMAALGTMIHEAIRVGAAGAYSEEQRAAWSPAPRSASAMAERVAGQVVLVAEDEKGLAGVFTLTKAGLLDLAFVRPDRKGDGLAASLHDAIVERAEADGLERLSVEASHLMRRFLERRGWVLVQTRTVHVNGVALENHRMMRQL